ncbi:hypothetical protein B5F76_05870 [Desulfovibrio sp. An276]|uniref:hypothetical protein n=1 Tax=Desulfovibrio sp. An276 TaxID=1965618 RepID=UPI000B3945D2|nr:hypothetical protein [Desulfovibrio sp. An276]OUO53304.1 hypothetical protein B5F76_05870 [Desulfovibrio sp. An276]
MKFDVLNGGIMEAKGSVTPKGPFDSPLVAGNEYLLWPAGTKLTLNGPSGALMTGGEGIYLAFSFPEQSGYTYLQLGGWSEAGFEGPDGCTYTVPEGFGYVINLTSSGRTMEVSISEDLNLVVS